MELDELGFFIARLKEVEYARSNNAAVMLLAPNRRLFEIVRGDAQHIDYVCCIRQLGAQSRPISRSCLLASSLI